MHLKEKGQLPAPAPVPAPQPALRRGKGLSFVVPIFLILLLAGSSAAWAVPEPLREWWWVGLRNTAEAYAKYIADYKNDPDPATRRRVEKAYFKIADKTESPIDLQDYLNRYPEGDPALREKALQKMETQRKAQKAEIQKQPKSEVPPEAVTPEPAKSSNRSGLTMVPVKGGVFIMGCQDGRDENCSGDEKPAHPVTLSGFEIGKYEVTQADWRAVLGSDPPKLAFPGCDDCPVERVSWNDVQAFLKKLNAKYPGKNYRLPTEAEWEYAARGGHKMPNDLSLMTAYPGGNDIGKLAWHDGNSSQKTHPVGKKTPNALGLYDMSGNVYEWCSDWFGHYPAAALTNPKGPKSGFERVRRGGAWGSDWQHSCRVAIRDFVFPSHRYIDTGLRLARTN